MPPKNSKPLSHATKTFGQSLDILFVVSECAPLVKTGGLADVAGSLPLALADLDCTVRVLLPAYPRLIEQLSDAKPVLHLAALFGGKARILAGTHGALNCLLLDAPHLFDREGAIYTGPDGSDWPDNDIRFAALAYAGAQIGQGALEDGWTPSVMHCHDWQAGLVPTYLRDAPNRPATVLSIHNIAFQGIFPEASVAKLGLPASEFTPEGFEFWGNLSTLKAGLIRADAISTVSETYARELMEPAFGMGLEGVIAARSADMRGIVNGIDLKTWNPETDPSVLPFNRKQFKDRTANRMRLVEEFGLTQTDGPLFGVVSRLTWQKGLDLLLETLPALLQAGGQLVLLGSGDADLEEAFVQAAAVHPGQVAVTIGYDEALSHRIYAGSDVVLVPSRFEPCGLTQLYALRYGALPLVARTGGLADTVIDANPAALLAGVATGFQFQPGSTDALTASILRACDLFQGKKLWRKMQSNAMAQPVGWTESARAYRRLYEDVLVNRTDDER